MAVAGAALGVGPAIEAAMGNGATGTFVVTNHTCWRRTGCMWIGTFEGRDEAVPDVAYRGSVPTGTGPGSRIPARYPGDHQAYACTARTPGSWTCCPWSLSAAW